MPLVAVREFDILIFYFFSMISFGKVEYRNYSKRRIFDKVDKGEW